MNGELTSEVISKVEAYAKAFYYGDSGYIIHKDLYSLEDVKQSALLHYIENGYTFKNLGGCLYYDFFKDYEKIDIERAKPFSKLELFDGQTVEERVETLGKSIDPYVDSVSNKIVKQVSLYMYPDNADRRNLFCDYLYGMPVVGSKARDMRLKLFRRARYIILYLYFSEVLTLRECKKYLRFLKGMRTYGRQKKPLLMDKNSISYRKYYEKTKEKQRERMLKNYYDKKEKQQLNSLLIASAQGNL